MSDVRVGRVDCSVMSSISDCVLDLRSGVPSLYCILAWSVSGNWNAGYYRVVGKYVWGWVVDMVYMPASNRGP